jgi:hypothetical protein
MAITAQEAWTPATASARRACRWRRCMLELIERVAIDGAPIRSSWTAPPA